MDDERKQRMPKEVTSADDDSHERDRQIHSMIKKLIRVLLSSDDFAKTDVDLFLVCAKRLHVELLGWADGL